MASLYGLPSPRLPSRRWSATVTAARAVTAVLHVAAIGLLLRQMPPAGASPPHYDAPVASAPDVRIVLPPHLLFLPSRASSGGGGGGGNRQRGPIRHAQGVGHDATTLRTTPRSPVAGAVDADPTPPPIVLDALPLASGTYEHAGLPVGGVSYGSSLGPGSGGGVGTGEGTGLGSGRGAGVGPGSGGGFGGGAYRLGAGVVAPRLISQIPPRYTAAALEQKVEGSVWLEVVVTRNGRTGDVRVQRSLDRGLDEEAVAAVRQWVFEPGRADGHRVDVVVTVVMDFWIH